MTRDNTFDIMKGIGILAVIAGHTTTDTVLKYISLDSERMKSCPISLSEAGISMEGGFAYE